MAAFLHVLATPATATIRTPELQRYLAAAALIRDSRAASPHPRQEACQRPAARLDWGSYRIATNHPALVRAREARS